MTTFTEQWNNRERERFKDEIKLEIYEKIITIIFYIILIVGIFTLGYVSSKIW